MSRVRAIFLGTPEIAAYCLQKMIEDEHFEIVGAVTQPDRPAGRSMKTQTTPVKAVAQKYQLPVLQVEKLKGAEAISALRQWNAECAVVVAFGQILGQEILDLYPKRVVNVHASLLPRWRGAAPIQRAIMAGDSETGVALQVMVKKLDAGDVLGVRKIKISDDMTALELHEEMKPMAADLLHIELMDYMRGHLAATPQDEAQVTVAPKIEKSEGLIHWDRSAIEISRQIRGLTLGPGCWTIRNGQRLKIHRVKAFTGRGSGKPGAISDVSENSFGVTCGHNSFLQIFEVQQESKAKMGVRDYLKGYPLRMGEVLG